MFCKKLSAKYLLSALALSGFLLTGVQAISWAGGNTGLTIFSGVERKDQLSYFLQFGGKPRQIDRYKLYVPAKKLTQGAAVFYISYPDYFDGEFDKDSIEIRVKGESVPLKDVHWDKESRFIEISPEQPNPGGDNVDIVLSNVRNPNTGTYYFVCDAVASGDVPVRLYLGTWIISIDN
jgi:hypothetical protein